MKYLLYHVHRFALKVLWSSDCTVINNWFSDKQDSYNYIFGYHICEVMRVILVDSNEK
jgi:hypothetical protein